MDELLVGNGDITLRVEVTGAGPTILCVHGWPEAPHSWRHQVAHFSDRGYRVAAMDVRGYGGSSAPPEIERYTLKELAGERDLVRAMVPGVDSFADPGSGCTDFRGSTIIPGAGHWVQQEAPAETNAALDAFLATL